MKTSVRANKNGRAFTLIELLIVIVCLGILAALLLPALARAKVRSGRINCENNLKQIGVAFRTWALDNGDLYPAQLSVTNGGTMELINSGVVYRHFQVMSNELSTPKILVCPYDSTRPISSTFASTVPPGCVNTTPFTNDANVSYFVGVDASVALPSMLLTGDANIAREGTVPKSGLQSFARNSDLSWYRPQHDRRNKGNIGLADGSVQQVNSRELRKLLMQTGVETNRLAMPAFP
jgi:prepilin-type N-terminal cleavage/methylation domain-containing protein